MSSSVRKAVIPVAGYGTRFLPATKSVPKTMFPVLDKPVLQYVIEEAAASGITDILVITNPADRTIAAHFAENEDLSAWLEKKRRVDILDELRGLCSTVNLTFMPQSGPYGSGTPILNAREFVAGEPFAILLGDEIFVGATPRLRQLLDTYDRLQNPVFGVIETDDQGTKRYGIVDPGPEVSPGIVEMKGTVEKPGPELAPSRLACVGSYVLTPDIFDFISLDARDARGENSLVEAYNGLRTTRPFYAVKLVGEYYDTGSTAGWLRANLALTLKRDDLRAEIQDMLRSVES
ncbi:MAG: UTP--glucose-1-phosphate uridylyltransferase [Patescibacteria group bacterium]